MKELESFETGKGRRKKTHVVVGAEEIQPREDLSKKNQGKRLAPKPLIYGDGKVKPGSQQERWTFGDENGINGGSYKPGNVVQDEIVQDEPMEEQRRLELMGQDKDIRRRIL